MSGFVAAGHPDTAAAGVTILRAGGTAADAAVASAFAATVAEASLTGLGAGGFALVRTPGGDARLLDFFVAAPGRGRSRADLDARSHLIEFYVPFRATTQLFNVGPSSCAVPGMIPGLTRLHADFGRLPLADVLEPAARLARRGATLVPQQDYLHDILEGILTESEDMRSVFAPEGTLLRAGDRLRMPDLADTLDLLAEKGSGAFATGEIAQAMTRAVDEAGGLITEADLAAYEVIERAPVRLDYRGFEFATNPPPSSGGTLIAFTLGLLGRRSLSRLSPADLTLALARALSATAIARREGFDHRVYEPGLAEEFLAAENLSRHDGDGSPTAGDARPSASGGRPPATSGNTTHISVIDDEGMAVSLTSSCGSGSGVVIPGTGIVMNNMMGEEDLNPGGAFSLEPGTRLTSMMAPTIVSGHSDAHPDRDVLLALGSAGSERLRSAIVQTVVHVLDGGLGGQAAVDHPRLHVDGATVHMEPGFDPSVEERLGAAGFSPHVWPEPDLFFGGVQAALRSCPEGSVGRCPDARYDGGADPRRGGTALPA